MSEKDFDLDFDFEKEYGFDTPEDTAAQQSGVDFDLKALLESEFGEEAASFTAEYDSDFDYGPETIDYLQDEGVEDPVPEAPVDEPLPEQDVIEDDFEEEPLEDDFDADLPEEMMSAEPLPVEEYAAPVEEEPAPVQKEAPVRRERRKPVSPMRRFKNETMPLIITGITALLILIFVIGSVTRLFGNIKHNHEAALNASEAAVNEAQRQDQEAQELLDEAARLAAEKAAAAMQVWLPAMIMIPQLPSWKASPAARKSIPKWKSACLSTSSRSPCWLLIMTPVPFRTCLSTY